MDHIFTHLQWGSSWQYAHVLLTLTKLVAYQFTHQHSWQNGPQALYCSSLAKTKICPLLEVKTELELGLIRQTGFGIGTVTRFPVLFICGTRTGTEIFKRKWFWKKPKNKELDANNLKFTGFQFGLTWNWNWLLIFTTGIGIYFTKNQCVWNWNWNLF